MPIVPLTRREKLFAFPKLCNQVSGTKGLLLYVGYWALVQDLH